MKYDAKNTKAYYDALGTGLIACRTLGFHYAEGLQEGSQMRIKITRSKGAYKTGEVIFVSVNSVPPRKCVKKRKNGTYIMPYSYEEK